MISLPLSDNVRIPISYTLLLSTLALLGCSSSISMPGCTGTSCVATPSIKGKISISVTRLLKDSLPWGPHGFVQIAFVAPPSAQSGAFLAAYQNYSPSEYVSMVALGADTVRMQVSQPGLDPSGPLFTQSFLTSVTDAVHAARSAGLNVIISIQDEKQSGESPKTVASLPNDATNRVWTELAPLFNNDTGILYELLNEPNLTATPSNYVLWAIAMNTTISKVRATGSTNVVVADGLERAGQLGGAPFLIDSANEVAYAEHPYFHVADDETRPVWDSKFGDFSTTAPVIVTEWAPSTPSSTNTFYCDAHTATDTGLLFQYLKDKGIGITNFAYDFDGPSFGSALYGFPPTLTSFANNAQCGSVGYGAGNDIRTWYSTGIVPSTPI